MDKKYRVTISTMLAGILVWIILIILHETAGAICGRSPGFEAGMCAVVGALIVFSGISCRQVGGPRIGNVVRTALLLITGLITWWRVGPVSASILACGAIITGVLALIGSKRKN
jgi:hypothetical protein